MKDLFKLNDYKQWTPYLDEDVVDCHYNMHHMKYVSNLIQSGVAEYVDVLNNPQQYTKQQNNNALQIYNHNVFWCSMKLNTEKFDINIDQFKKSANSIFGSGWAWIVQNLESKDIEFINTKDADRPDMNKYKILACLDVWEHAYYLQYRGNRVEFVEIFCTYLLNYDFIKQNLI